MYARLTQFQILPDKLDPFLAAVQSAVPHAQQQHGFRAILVLRAQGAASAGDVRVLSLWDSLEDLQAGEQNFYFYQALAKVMAFSKGFPLIENQQVLFAELEGAQQRRRASADETKS